MVKPTILLSAVLLPLVLSLGRPGTRIRFAPVEGTRVTRTYSSKAEFTVDNLSISVVDPSNDDARGTPPGPDPNISITSSQEVVVSDEYMELGDGMPVRLGRRFDRLGNDVRVAIIKEPVGEFQTRNPELHGESELRGRTVVFTWDATLGNYRKAFEPVEERDELLGSLTEDMDLRALLPSGEKHEGDDWDIDVNSLSSILSPGGNLAILPKREELESAEMGFAPPGMGSIADWLGGPLEGTAKATFAEIRDVDGAELAVINLRIEVHTSTDMTDAVRGAMRHARLPAEAGNPVVEQMRIKLSIDADGVLLWDLGSNRARSFTIHDGDSSATMSMTVSLENPSLTIKEAVEMSGKINLSLEIP